MRKWIKHISSLLFILVLMNTTTFSQSVGVNSVLITFETIPTTWSVNKTLLKYNKQFALSLHINNAHKDIYTHAFQYLNGGSIDGTIYPGLTFTDGCNNLINFRMGTSLYSFASDSLTDIHVPTGDYSDDFITWPEAVELYQAGWGLFSQGLLPDNSGNPEYSIARNHSFVKFKTNALIPGGIPMTVLVNPNEDNLFTDPAFNQDYHAAFSDYLEGIEYYDISLIPNAANLKMGSNSLDNQQSLAALADRIHSNYNPNTRLWASANISTITDGNTQGYTFSVFRTYMDYIEKKYGSKGSLDNIWVASEEEVWDYLTTYKLVTIHEEWLDNQLLITFSGSLPANLNHYALSLFIETDAIIQSVENIEIDGGFNNSKAIVSETSALINLNWEGATTVSNEVLAEDYVAHAESSGNRTTENALVAMDYVNMLDYGPKKTELRERLCDITEAILPTGYCSCEFSLGNDMLICKGDCIDLTAPDDNTYLWSTGETTQNIHDCPETNSTYTVTVSNQYACTSSATINVGIHPTFEIQTSEDAIVCPNDSLNIWAAGGETYSWEETGETTDTIRVSSDVARYYTVSVFNEFGCEIKGSVFVDVFTASNISVTDDVEICPGDSTLLTASVGYTYEWSDGTTSNSTTVFPDVDSTFYVTVYNIHNCPTTESVLVSLRTPPLISAGNDTSKCFSDCIDLKATGGESYFWNNGVSSRINQVCPAVETEYIVTGTDEFGCSSIDSVVVHINDHPDVNLSGLLPVYCENASAILLEGSPPNGAFGGDGVSGNIFSPSSAGVGEHPIYYSIVDNAGCAVGDTVDIRINEIPDFTLGEDITLCIDETYQIFLPNNFDQYLWSNGQLQGWYFYVDISKFDIGTTNLNVIVSNNGCVARDTIAITYESCNVGIEDLEEIGIIVYPNPSSGIFNIKYDGTQDNQYFSIHNMRGQEIYTEKLDECRENKCNKTIDVSFLNKGIYLIRFYNEKGIRSGKFIIQ